jgi:hypothetical protein
LLLTASPGGPFWLDRAFRLAQVLVPAGAAAAFLAASVRLDRTARGLRVRARARDEFDLFLAATSAGVLALCGAVFLFTEPRSYGSWSLPVPVFFVSLASLSVLPARPPTRRLGPLLAVIACVCLAVFMTLHRQLDHNERYRRLYMRREVIAGLYRGRPPRLIEVDDGIVGFATGFHTLSGFGFAADRELHEALREGRLLSLARERGYDRIASLLYLPLSPGPESSLLALGSFYRDDTGGARFALEYFDANLPFAIVRITYPPSAARR